MTDRAPLTRDEFDTALDALMSVTRAHGRDTAAYLLRYAFRAIDIEVLPASPSVDRPTAQQVLATEMLPNDVRAPTVEAYLLTLLDTLWTKKEGFGGKRPFGNSGWAYDLYEALGNAGYIFHERDEMGYPSNVDTELGDELIHEAIEALGRSR